MSLLARLFDFQPNTLIRSADLDSEFNQIVNMLSGVSQSKSLKVRNDDPAFAVARFDQLAANNITEYYASGVEKAKIEVTGKFKSLVPTGTAPIDVASTTVCPNLNADLIDGIEGADITRLSLHKSAISYSWFYSTPPGAVESVESVGRFNASPGNAITITQIRAVFAGGSHTAGGELIFTLKRRNTTGAQQADIGTITIGDGSVINNLEINNLGTPVVLSDGDQIYPLLTTRGGTITETLITVIVIGTQKFFP